MFTFNQSQPFLDSFSAERPNFQGYSSDFEESVVSQDYWKLISGPDGQLSWQEDGSLDFDLSALAMGTVSAEDMSVLDILDIVKREMRVTHHEEASEQGDDFNYIRAFGTENFINFNEGTKSLINASKIANKMMSNDENLTNANLSSFFSSLQDVQDRGLITRNVIDPIIFDSTNPLIFPEDDDHVLNTSPRGYRFRIQQGSEEASAIFHKGGDYAVYREDWSRYTNGEVGVRFNQESEVTMQWMGAYGLQVQTTGDWYRAKNSHLHSSTIMDYLSAFGTSGVSLDNGVLSNVPAGFQIGRIGNTGTQSSGPHLDLITEMFDEVDNTWSSFDPELYYPALSEHSESNWSQAYAGYDQPIVTSEVMMNMWGYNNNSSSYWPYVDFMAPGVMELGYALEIFNE